MEESNRKKGGRIRKKKLGKKKKKSEMKKRGFVVTRSGKQLPYQFVFCYQCEVKEFSLCYILNLLIPKSLQPDGNNI